MKDKDYRSIINKNIIFLIMLMHFRPYSCHFYLDQLCSNIIAIIKLNMAQRKQNRCTEHQQQIVALCIDQNCQQKVKAVCPLQLYNDHLDHKFQNISKVHSQWVLYGKDCKEIHDNISREGMLKYMDGIIEELMFKIKEHLFLLRKELDVKMGMYFNSKPVDKIRSALNGINKCLEERFLDLRHEEIQDAKFFIQIYGIKKLVNDTMTQRQNFEKQILIAYAKIKEEMFMDYPKFNALVKAKQYEYCQIIKAQKTQIAVLKQKLSQTSGGLQKISEQHKQLTYEYSRTLNELKNKESALSQTTDKLKIMTNKFNQQAQQAILKARQIKTKNILGTYPYKHLFRVSDRILKTGDEDMDWPGLAEVGEAQGKIFVKLTRFDVGSWVLLGVMMRGAVQKNEFQFDNYRNIGHGCYLMDSNRWCYSNHDEDFNCKPLGFEYGHNDIIKVEVFETLIRFSKMAFGWQQQKFELPYQKKPNDQMVFCIGIKGVHTEIQLV